MFSGKVSVTVCRRCMGGAELAPLSRDRTCERVGAETRRLSPTMNRPCFLPDDGLCIKGLSHRIEVWPTNLPCRRGVLCDAGLDCQVAVRLGWVVLAEGDVGRRLPLVGHSICLELTARPILISCDRDCRKATKWMLELRVRKQQIIKCIES